jgi:phospholipid transport system substrate-binding protein
MSLSRPSTSPVIFTLTLLSALCANVASAAAGPAEDAVKQMHQAAVKDDVETLDRHVAYDAIARASLAKHWTEFSEEEQSRFVDNFRIIVRRSYRKGLGGKQIHPLKFKGESESPEGPLVHTLVEIKKGEPELAIDYLMRCPEPKANACQLVDVVTDGSSLVKSWRRMFQRIIKRHGKAELLDRIEKKAKSED